MRVITKQVFNDMGDGYDEYLLIADDDGKNVTIVHVGRFYNGVHSVVDTTGMDQRGYRI
jgi:hypothetical protein